MVNLKVVINTFDKILSYENVHIFIFISIALLSQSCGKEKGAGCTGTPGTKYFTLTTEAINQTPYFTNKAFDTISFASDKGDTLTFVKTKTDTLWFEEPGNGSPDCGYNKNSYQTLHNSYTTIKGTGSFDVKQSLKRSTSQLFGSYVIEISFNNLSLNMYDYWIGDAGYKTFMETFTVGSKTYNKSIVIYPLNGGSDAGMSYINKEYGAYYNIEKSSNLNWQLIK